MTEKKFPARAWLLRQKVAGKVLTCWSYDGPPSEAYVPMVSLEEAESLKREAVAETIEKIGLEIGKKFHPASLEWIVLGKILQAAREGK